jgi:adenylyltransferase/sulfurtransferase
MNESLKRYKRQMTLPEFGPDGQDRLLKAGILCVGAGGLGAPALLYLAAAGVGRIGIIDRDRVDESNLQRQILFATRDIGQPKVKAAAERLTSLNPGIRIETYDEELDARSASRLFPLYDIILDGTDNFETKFLINDAALKFGKPWIYGAIQGFDGQVSVFNHAGGACYRCFQPATPKSRIMNCAEAGVIGAIAGLVGTAQAMQAIQMIVGHDSFAPLSSKLWLLDARTMQVQTLSLKKNENCPACAAAPEDISLSYVHSSCFNGAEISVASLKERGECLLMDVREPDEWERGSIEGALLWPLSRLMKGEMPDLQKDAKIVLYCQKGARSLQALYLMQEQGFTQAASLSGGYEAYQVAIRSFSP